MRANEKRIVGFALKSRLRSVYNNRETVEAGGLMSYGADLARNYRVVREFMARSLHLKFAILVRSATDELVHRLRGVQYLRAGARSKRRSISAHQLLTLVAVA
jgi:hypothetical protein